MLSVAVRDYEWLPANPLGKVKKPPEPPSRVRFLTVEERQHPVDPDSPLGRAMAAAREAWAAPGYVPLDPDTFTVTPASVDVNGE